MYSTTSLGGIPLLVSVLAPDGIDNSKIVPRSVASCELTYMYIISYYHRIPQLRLTFCMLTLGKIAGLMHGIVTFPRDDHYRPMNATWMHDLCTFSGCLIGAKQ